MSTENLKKIAAEKAVEQVKNGMVLGLGTGSTTKYAVMKLGELWQAGQLTDIVGVPTSQATVALAGQYGLPLASLHEHSFIDLAIDGADEIAPNLDLIKGLGGALLREKMIESAAQHFIIVADETKLVSKLGTHAPLPVEVVQFSWQTQARWLESLGCRPVLRSDAAQPYLTDNGNYILDCHFPNGIDNPAVLAAHLDSRTGIVEHGLFLNMANEAIIASLNGLQCLSR
jgi:ribose 5-phosphate isomerase A